MANFATQTNFSTAGFNIGAVWRDNAGGIDIVSRVYTNQAELTTVTVDSGAADGVNGVRISGPEGTFEYQFISATSSISVIHAGLVVAGLAVVGLDFVDIGGTDPDVTNQFRRAGIDYTVVLFGSAVANLSVVETTSGTKARLLTGVAVTRTATGGIEPAASPTLESEIVGITMFGHSAVEPQDPNDATQTEDGFIAGRDVPLVRTGPINVRLAAGATPAIGDQLRILTTGAEAGFFTDTGGLILPGTYESTPIASGAVFGALADFRS